MKKFLLLLIVPFLSFGQIPITDDNIQNAVDEWLSNPASAMEIYGNISEWDVSNVTDMSYLFQYAYSFNDDISEWDVSSVTDMSYLFQYAYSFNQDIGNWDVSNVTTMKELFAQAWVFNQNIGNWNTSNVVDMESIFQHALEFNQDIGNWDVSNVITMAQMFGNASAFNQDIGSWDVSNVTNMVNLFYSAAAFNQDIGNWDVSSVIDMTNMFANCNIDCETTFNQDISNWDISNVTNMSYMFNNAGLSTSNYDALLIAWSQLNVQNNVNFSAGSSTYCIGADAKEILEILGWSITDGGYNCDGLGCTYPTACNYNPEANEDDGSCTYPEAGFNCDGSCIDIDNNGNCDGEILCMDPLACNYNENATWANGSCIYANGACEICSGETDGTGVIIYNDSDNDGICDFEDDCPFDPSNIVDCNGECGGDAVADNCGTCDNDASNDCVQDCAGEWGGDAVVDCNGECGGDAIVDECGVCGGTGPEFGYGCDGNCLSDLDGDGVCDFEDDCPFDPENDIDEDGVCSDCDDMLYVVEDCECEFIDPATYTVFYIDVDEENCITTEACYCECYNDQNNNDICDENEKEGCMDMTACNYDDEATEDDGSCAFPGEPCELDNGTMGVYNDLCECVVDTSSIYEYNNHKTLIKTIDILGRETANKGFQLHIYDDGCCGGRG